MSSINILSSNQPVHFRTYRHDVDWWRVRSLLLEAYPISPPGWNWEVRRWDGSRFHEEHGDLKPNWLHWIGLWETSDGHLAGAVHPDDAGTAVLQLLPDYRHAEVEMLAWGEDHLAIADPAVPGKRRLLTYVFEYDNLRRRLLESRGYVQTQDWGVWRRLRFGDKVIPQANLAAGYTLRSARKDDPAEHDAFAALLNAAFNRTFHQGAEIAHFRRQAPCYDPELDLFAIAPDGSLAANVGTVYMPEVHAGLFEPVCTHPDHRQKGLAQSLMWEGMRRLLARGAREVTVDTGDMVPANKLYDSVGFPETYKGAYWRKEW